MTEQSTEDRFRNLWGRDMNATEREFFRLRESGYNGWFNWETGKAQTEAEVQADREAHWAENEKNGLVYTREHGWARREQER